MKRQRTAATWLGAILGTLCALALVAAESYAAETQPLVTEEFHQTYPLAAGGRIELKNINGAVHITAWDRDEVKVDAVKSAHSKQRLDQAKIAVDAASDHISIRTEYAEHDLTFNRDENDNPASVEYTLMVPRKARLDAIKLINGALDVQGMASDVHASCINGKLTARGLSGPVHLSTINGRLDVQFETMGDSTLELSSVNGPLSLTLPSDVKATLEATTVHGGINDDFGLRVHNHRFVGHDMRGELGGGGTHIQMRNVNGPIELKHASDGRTLSPAKDQSQSSDDAEI